MQVQSTASLHLQPWSKPGWADLPLAVPTVQANKTNKPVTLNQLLSLSASCEDIERKKVGRVEEVCPCPHRRPCGQTNAVHIHPKLQRSNKCKLCPKPKGQAQCAACAGIFRSEIGQAAALDAMHPSRVMPLEFESFSAPELSMKPR